MRIVEFLLVSDLWIVTFEISAKNLPTDPLARQWMVINLFHCGNLETFCFLVTLCPSPALVGSRQTPAKADSEGCGVRLLGWEQERGMVGVCSCVQEKEAIPQKLHQACTDFRSESIFQLWLKHLSRTSHQILFWQLNFTFGTRPCLRAGESLPCSHRCSQGVQSCCSCTWGCGAQPTSSSSFRAADPHGTSRALQGHPRY